MLTETFLEGAAVELAARIRGRRYGSIVVRDVTPKVITDVNGYLSVELDVQLNDPDGETWPIDDVMDLERDVRSERRTFPELFMVYVLPRPTTEEEEEPDLDDDDDEG